MNGPHARVLVVGGGDGMAAREVLRHPGVRAVTVVELDPGVVRLARTDPALARLNGRAFRDPRVRVVHEDAFHWLRGAADRVRERYDVVISDLPDPGITPSTKLYSEEFYGLVARVLDRSGRFAVHAGSVTDRPHTYWTVDSTLRAAGFATRPYSASGCTPASPRAPTAPTAPPVRAPGPATGASSWPSPATGRPSSASTPTGPGRARSTRTPWRPTPAAPNGPGCPGPALLDAGAPAVRRLRAGHSRYGDRGAGASGAGRTGDVGPRSE